MKQSLTGMSITKTKISNMAKKLENRWAEVIVLVVIITVIMIVK
mgnify:CR=1 FL=1